MLFFLGFLQSLIVLDVEFIHPASIKVRCIMVFIHGVTHTIGSAMLLSCLMCNISAENSEGNRKLNGYVVLTKWTTFHIYTTFSYFFFLPVSSTGSES